MEFSIAQVLTSLGANFGLCVALFLAYDWIEDRTGDAHPLARSLFTGKPMSAYQSSISLCVAGIGSPSSTPMP